MHVSPVGKHSRTARDATSTSPPLLPNGALYSTQQEMVGSSGHAKIPAPGCGNLDIAREYGLVYLPRAIIPDKVFTRRATTNIKTELR